MWLFAVRWTKDLPKLHAGLDAGPLLVFDKSGSVLVISAFDNFMSVSYEHDVNSSTVSWGIMGKVSSIPKGFQYSTVVYYSASGINKVCSVQLWKNNILYLFYNFRVCVYYDWAYNVTHCGLHYHVTVGLQAMIGWGETIRRWYGRSMNVDHQLDISSDYIGYYTDNGMLHYT